MADLSFPTFCRTSSQAGVVLTSTVSIYKQCIDLLTPGALLKRIKPGDQLGGSGVTIDDEVEYTDISAADSTKPTGRLFSANIKTFKVNVQRDAFDPIYSQLVLGKDFEEDPDNADILELQHGDQVGKLVPRYSVVVDVFESGKQVCWYFAPDCELMISGRGAMAAGQVYKHELSLMPQVYDDFGNRVTEKRPKALVRGSIFV